MNYSNKKNSDMIRIWKDTKVKLQEIKMDIIMAEKKEIRMPELVKRITNIPNLKNVLIEDAIKKRQKKYV